jgi:predicted metal-dependent hydrolase
MKKERTIQLGTDVVAYTLRKRRGQKRLSLSVREDGAVSLAVPWWVPVRVAEEYLHEKRDWLHKALARVPKTAMSAEARAAHYKEHKEAARIFVHKRLKELNAGYGFSWGRVAIRKNTSCWGSCSSKRNLNFDYRILFLPAHLQDYILVHELCHLQEMNHSKHFWVLVAQTVSNYAACRRELRHVREGW